MPAVGGLSVSTTPEPLVEDPPGIREPATGVSLRSAEKRSYDSRMSRASCTDCSCTHEKEGIK